MQSLIEIIAEHSKQNPDKLCLADQKNRVTYEEYFRLIYGFSEYLKSQGIQKGDCVVVKAVQKIPYLVAGMAIQLLGAIFVPLEKVVAEERIREIIQSTDAKLVIAEKQIDCSCSYLSFAIIDECVFLDTIPWGTMDFPKGEQTAEILFSTGTTGKSKGIELSHQSIIAVAENVKYGVEMKQDNIELIPVPLNHSHGLRRYYANMLNGSSVVVMDGVVFMNRFFQTLERYRVTAIDLVPAMLAIIFKLSKDQIKDYAHQLEYIQIGSAKLPESDKQRLSELLPKARLYDFFGSTEAGCSCIINYNEFKGKNACIGKPTCNSYFKFVDDEGNEIETSVEKTGFLTYGGTMMMKGYWNDPELTQNTVREGYLYSSDLGYQGEDGFIYLIGRHGDVINIAGMKVDPFEIEEKVMLHPNIADCACVPVLDEIAGQAPKLFIVLENGKTCSPIEMREFLDQHLESYKLPKVMETIDKIPRTYNGKIIRKQLV